LFIFFVGTVTISLDKGTIRWVGTF